MRNKTWLASATRRRIIVHTKTDQTFDGILETEYVDGVLLRSVSLVESSSKSTPLPGEVRIHRDNVAFVQSPDDNLTL